MKQRTKLAEEIYHEIIYKMVQIIKYMQSFQQCHYRVNCKMKWGITIGNHLKLLLKHDLKNILIDNNRRDIIDKVFTILYFIKINESYLRSLSTKDKLKLQKELGIAILRQNIKDKNISKALKESVASDVKTVKNLIYQQQINNGRRKQNRNTGMGSL